MTASMAPVVQIKDLQRIYDSGEVKVHAVRGVSLELHRGEFLAIMGASGSGKSTLMNTLGCLDRPTSGSYLLDGVDVLKLDRNALADLRNEKLGFVFQGFNLLSRTTALENVELPMLYGRQRGSSKDMRDRALHALDIVGLSQRADHFPSQLSGGQQQRVAIARALVNQPQLLLADEPTGNLDSKTSVEVMGVFQKLNDQGITIVMVTHELDIAQYCRRSVIMRDGRIVSDLQITNRNIAAVELQKIHAAETDAKLIGQD
jgi:putative ABC transport system ATP-binding protein